MNGGIRQARDEIGAISDLDLLSQSEIWRAHLKKEPSAADEFQEIVAIREDAIDKLDESNLLATDGFAYAEQCQTLRLSEEQSMCNLTKVLTMSLGREGAFFASIA